MVFNIRFLVIHIASFLFLPMIACSSTETVAAATVVSPSTSVQDASPTRENILSQAERDSLLFMREEEKLARDVYRALDMYGNPFSNIQNSEQRHTASIAALLKRYGLPDPAEGNGVGEFTNKDLQTLYDTLVAQGSVSLNEALLVGCTIEELDIRDLERAKHNITHSDILDTYNYLLLGSRNHLRAFYRRLTRFGGSYTPRYIDQETFDAIVSSPKERP